ncbi:type II toxin-antitoxin system HicB family antitoxin [Duganella sp. CT11-25]|uniref:type II toxin-antitoxin system HicB family antitoxin n=1 Tax=unclassified Duganella TaxID=2636909 RepID=UPI0039AEC3D9
MMRYPASFTAEEGKIVVRFRDIPEAITQGDDEKDAFEMAEDVLLSSMDFYFEDGRRVPPPSVALPGERYITLPLSVASKVLLLNEMLIQKVGPSELARRMDSRPQYVNRLIDLHHNTKIDTVAEAMAALGKRLELRAI